MSSNWAKLAELPGRRGVRAAWGSFPVELLMPAEGFGSPTLPCDSGHACYRVIVEHGPGDAVGICMQLPPHCEARAVRKDERVVYRFDERKLFSKIISLLGINGAPEQLSPDDDLWKLGALPPRDDCTLPAFLILARNSKAVDHALGRLLSSNRECFLLIVSDGQFIKEQHRDAAHHARSLIISLDDIFKFDHVGALLTVSGSSRLIESWRSAIAPAPNVAISKFPTPESAKWSDVTITFVNQDVFQIKCAGQASRSWNRVQMPEMFQANTAYQKPSFKWHVLLAFAVHGPCLDYADLERISGGPKGRDKIKKQISDLRTMLQEFFDIEGDPLPFDRKLKVYKPELTIRLDTNARAELWKESGKVF